MRFVVFFGGYNISIRRNRMLMVGFRLWICRDGKERVIVGRGMEGLFGIGLGDSGCRGYVIFYL